MKLQQRLWRWYTELVTPAAPDVPFTRPVTPLHRLTVSLITTAGVRLADQLPFDVALGDPSYRVIPGDADPVGLIPDHTHYDTGPARADLDCVFPLCTLRELAARGEIGGVAPVHFGFMGYIPDTAPLEQQSIPEVTRRLREAGVGAVLLSPG